MARVKALIPKMANMCFHHFSQSPNFLCLSYHLEKYYQLVWILGPTVQSFWVAVLPKIFSMKVLAFKKKANEMKENEGRK